MHSQNNSSDLFHHKEPFPEVRRNPVRVESHSRFIPGRDKLSKLLQTEIGRHELVLEAFGTKHLAEIRPDLLWVRLFGVVSVRLGESSVSTVANMAP